MPWSASGLSMPEISRGKPTMRRQRESWGPLHGLPMTVKDSYNVEGCLPPLVFLNLGITLLPRMRSR